MFVIFKKKKKTGHTLQSNKTYLRIGVKTKMRLFVCETSRRVEFRVSRALGQLRPPLLPSAPVRTVVRYRNTSEPSAARRVKTKVTRGRISPRIIVRVCNGACLRSCTLPGSGMCNTFSYGRTRHQVVSRRRNGRYIRAVSLTVVSAVRFSHFPISREDR